MFANLFKSIKCCWEVAWAIKFYNHDWHEGNVLFNEYKNLLFGFKLLGMLKCILADRIIDLHEILVLRGLSFN
jgi:hypothetical protein